MTRMSPPRSVATLPDEIRARVRVDGDFHTPDELLELLRDFDWVVATRMHLAILTLGVGTPVLPIAYEFKTTELFKSLHHEIEPPTDRELDSGKLGRSLRESLWRPTAAWLQSLNEAVDRCRQQAWEVADVLRVRFPEFASAADDDSDHRARAETGVAIR